MHAGMLLLLCDFDIVYRPDVLRDLTIPWGCDLWPENSGDGY
jgi:hypothetical protein